MAKNNQLLVYIVIGAIVALAFGLVEMPSGISDMFSSSDDVDNLYPSDLKTTVTLNTGDELATSATDANVSYYVFSSSGKFLKEGTTSAGTASFTVPSGGDYELLVWDDDASSPDYLAKWVTFSTNGDSPEDRAVSTINVDLMKESTFNINALQDPVDLNQNLSHGLGQTVNFQMLFSANTSNAAGRKAVILIDVNSSEVQEITLSGTSVDVCPNRISVTAGHKYYCFLYDKIVTSSDGIQSLSGTLLMDSSTAATTNLGIRILDTGIYQDADYKTKGKAAFHDGTENPVTDADVGAADSAVVYLDYSG